jgi:hypothetical protein
VKAVLAAMDVVDLSIRRDFNREIIARLIPEFTEA